MATEFVNSNKKKIWSLQNFSHRKKYDIKKFSAQEIYGRAPHPKEKK